MGRGRWAPWAMTVRHVRHMQSNAILRSATVRQARVGQRLHTTRSSVGMSTACHCPHARSAQSAPPYRSSASPGSTLGSQPQTTMTKVPFTTPHRAPRTAPSHAPVHCNVGPESWERWERATYMSSGAETRLCRTWRLHRTHAHSGTLMDLPTCDQTAKAAEPMSC